LRGKKEGEYLKQTVNGLTSNFIKGRELRKKKGTNLEKGHLTRTSLLREGSNHLGNDHSSTRATMEDKVQRRGEVPRKEKYSVRGSKKKKRSSGTGGRKKNLDPRRGRERSKKSNLN